MADPIPMILTCPVCCGRHVDKGAFATKPHHTHACQHIVLRHVRSLAAEVAALCEGAK